MLYDNRMYPQAVEHDGNVQVVSRGRDGLPYTIAYDMEAPELSEPFMLLTGMETG